MLNFKHTFTVTKLKEDCRTEANYSCSIQGQELSPHVENPMPNYPYERGSMPVKKLLLLMVVRVS